MWNKWFLEDISSFCFLWIYVFMRLFIWLFTSVPPPQLDGGTLLAKYKNCVSKHLHKEQSESPENVAEVKGWGDSNWQSDTCSNTCLNKSINSKLMPYNFKTLSRSWVTSWDAVCLWTLSATVSYSVWGTNGTQKHCVSFKWQMCLSLTISWA